MTQIMKAVILNEYGGPEVLKVGEVPVPQPGPKEVRCRIFMHLNFFKSAHFRC